MKKVIRLTENDLHRIIKNSVKRILKESEDDMSKYIPQEYYDREKDLKDSIYGDDYSDFLSKLKTKKGQMDFDFETNKTLHDDFAEQGYPQYNYERLHSFDSSKPNWLGEPKYDDDDEGEYFPGSAWVRGGDFYPNYLRGRKS